MAPRTPDPRRRRPTAPAAAPASPVTARAVAVGLVGAVLINLVMNYNDFYLNNTLLIGNHFPTAGMAILLALVLGLNAPVGSRWRFAPGELMLIWGMLGVAGGIGASGLMRYLPGYLGAPAYYASNANEFGAYVLPHLPDWMLLGKHGDDPAIRWFFEGLPRGHAIPWLRWLLPLGCWLVFWGCLTAVMFALAALFHRHWADRERLVFPITYLPVALAQAPDPGRRLNAFLRNRLVWVGAAIPIAIYGLNGLAVYVPAIPQVTVSWPLGGLFPDRPWSELTLGDAHVYFSVVGLTFLLTSEVALSFWLFYLLYRLSFVWLAWLGAGATGFWGNWSSNISVYEAAGGVLAIAGWLGWSARGSLRAWWTRVRTGEPAPAEPMAPRLVLGLLAGGFAGMVGWTILAGASWWAAALAIALFVCVLLCLTRIVAESGLLFVISDVAPVDVCMGWFPVRWLTAPTLAVLSIEKGVVMHTLREILMPYLMNGMRAGELVRLHARRVLAVFALTAAVAVVAAAYGRTATCYKYGAANGDEWGNIHMPQNYFGKMATFQKTPPPYEWISLGGSRVLPVAVAHTLVGAGLAAGLLVLRAVVGRWPLTPYGFLMCGTWGIEAVWFSLLLGWLAKTAIMTFGGATAYRRFLPFFLGLVMGESIMATLMTLVSLATGRPGLWLLPP